MYKYKKIYYTSTKNIDKAINFLFSKGYYWKNENVDLSPYYLNKNKIFFYIEDNNSMLYYYCNITLQKDINLDRILKIKQLL